MTNEELAKHWNVSISEVERISKFINERYYLCLGQKGSDKLWYGLLYEKVPEARPLGEIPERRPRLALSSKKGYKTAKEAAEFMNTCMDTVEMSKERARLMGIPKDAFRIVKKLDVFDKERDKTYICGRSLSR